jgi:hypothetical protein
MVPLLSVGLSITFAVQPPARKGLHHWSDLTDFAAMMVMKNAPTLTSSCEVTYEIAKSAAKRGSRQSSPLRSKKSF